MSATTLAPHNGANMLATTYIPFSQDLLACFRGCACTYTPLDGVGYRKLQAIKAWRALNVAAGLGLPSLRISKKVVEAAIYEGEAEPGEDLGAVARPSIWRTDKGYTAFIEDSPSPSGL